MRVLILNPEMFTEAIERFPKKEKSINAMHLTLQSAEAKNSSELKNLLPSMEKFPGKDHAYRFDIGGRKGLRMIAVVVIHDQEVDVQMIGTHDEYDNFTF